MNLNLHCVLRIQHFMGRSAWLGRLSDFPADSGTSFVDCVRKLSLHIHLHTLCHSSYFNILICFRFVWEIHTLYNHTHIWSRKRFSVCWFTPQIPTIAKADSGWLQEPGTQSRSIFLAGTQVLEPLHAAFQGAHWHQAEEEVELSDLNQELCGTWVF